MVKFLVTLTAVCFAICLCACSTNDTATANRQSTATSPSASASRNVRKIAVNGKEVMVVDTPSSIASLLKSLTAGNGKDFRLERAQMSAQNLKVLDQYSAEAAGVSECKILSVEGCNSCCADGVSSSLRHTTCGDFCDKVCGSEPCH